jgi:hypothetical protein
MTQRQIQQRQMQIQTPLTLLGLQPRLSLSVPMADLQTPLHLGAGADALGPCGAVLVLCDVQRWV